MTHQPDEALREARFDALMTPIEHAQHAPAGLLDPPAVHVLPGARSHLQVPFAEVHGWRPLRLDVHLPEAPSEVPWPAVLYVHGGSFLTGMPALGPWGTLPAQGIAVVSVGYRFAAEAPFPAPVEDVRAALAWIAARAERYGLDPEKLALWGGSAGGFLAALVAITGHRALGHVPRLLGTSVTAPVPRPAGVITQYAVTDPARLYEDAPPGGEAAADALVAAIGPFFGDSGAPPSVLDHLDSPELVPPFFLMHGDADQRVGIEQSRRLRVGLRAAGVPADFVEVPGAGHGTPEWGRREPVACVVDRLRDWWSQ